MCQYICIVCCVCRARKGVVQIIPTFSMYWICVFVCLFTATVWDECAWLMQPWLSQARRAQILPNVASPSPLLKICVHLYVIVYRVYYRHLRTQYIIQCVLFPTRTHVTAETVIFLTSKLLNMFILNLAFPFLQLVNFSWNINLLEKRILKKFYEQIIKKNLTIDHTRKWLTSDANGNNKIRYFR